MAQPEVTCTHLLSTPVLRRKRKGPGITKNETNNGAKKTTNNPTIQPPKSQRTNIYPCRPTHLAAGGTPPLQTHNAHVYTCATVTYVAHAQLPPLLSKLRPLQRQHCLLCVTHAKPTCTTRTATNTTQYTFPIMTSALAPVSKLFERGDAIEAR